jgi:DNA-binding response OmpR family regulator
MPRVDGLGVVDELRAHANGHSRGHRAHAQSGDSEEKALDLGAHDYLSKPVQTRSLIGRVRAVLKRINT